MDIPLDKIHELLMYIESRLSNPDNFYGYTEVAEWYNYELMRSKCSKKHEGECRGELWECDNCESVQCWAVGSTDNINLCDECFMEKMIDA